MLGYYIGSGAEFVPKLVYKCFGGLSDLSCRREITDLLSFHAIAATDGSMFLTKENGAA